MNSMSIFWRHITLHSPYTYGRYQQEIGSWNGDETLLPVSTHLEYTQVPSRLGLPNWTSFFFGWAVKKDGVAKSDSKTSIIGGIRSHYHRQKKNRPGWWFWNYIIILSNIYIYYVLFKQILFDFHLFSIQHIQQVEVGEPDGTWVLGG